VTDVNRWAPTGVDDVLADEREDFALRRPGALARDEALRLASAAPKRSFLARLFGGRSEEWAWRVGAEGEELVGKELARLVAKDPRWRVLHSVPVGGNGADIDHVVIGPGGVFTLNTKHHRGARIWVAERAFLVNGVRQPYLRNSRHEAERAARLLSRAAGFPVAVTGVVVPVNARELVVKRPPVDVHVVNRTALRRWLRRRVDVLGPEAVDRLYEAARRPVTWS
jgi:hypothetical protein